MAGCATCPDPIKAILRRRVARDLNRVRAIKYMTTAVNRLMTQLIAKALDDRAKLLQLVSAIPNPVLLLTDLIDWLTCPLLPIAILEVLYPNRAAFENQDADAQIKLLKSMLSPYVDDLTADYQNGLRSLPSYDLLSILQGYLDELKRIDLDAQSFTRSVAITATIAGLAIADEGCAAEYVEGPYAEFSDEITDFSFIGPYPAGFDPAVIDILDQLAEADGKLAGWRRLIVTPL